MVKKCENCGREIQDNRNYETHVQRCVFNRTKTLACDKCNRKYSYRSSMYLHRRSCNGIREDDDCDEYNTVYLTKSNKMKSSINKRSRNRTSHEQQNMTVNLLKPGDKYKYVMCLRTKTCHKIKANENDVNPEQIGLQLESDDVNLIEESQESEVNEIIIEELPELEADNSEPEPVDKSDDQAIVVLEDFGFFNKVEIRNMKHEVADCDENVDEFQDC